MLAGMWVGSYTYCMQSFDLETYCREMAACRANWAHIVPPIAIQLADSAVAAKYDLTSVKIMLISAAPTKRALQQRLKQRFGEDMRIIQGKPLYSPSANWC
jgi:acyl-CoA synthetase (AMP-forming)/AMP-acid ligase II